MNILTRKIRDKGYTLKEFCDVYLICLRTYRNWEKTDHKNHDELIADIDSLIHKDEIK